MLQIKLLQLKKDVAANKQLLQIHCKNEITHWYPVLTLFRWVPCFVLVVGRKPAKNQNIAQLATFPYSSQVLQGPSGIGSEAKQPVVKGPMNFQEF